MPSAPPLLSYAPNREDVVLARALAHIPRGRYVDIGAGLPRDGSTTRALYERGWCGTVVEPDPARAADHRETRPRDTVVEVDATTPGAVAGILHDLFASAGPDVDHAAALGSAHAGAHVLVIDAAVGPQALEGVDLGLARPWVLVIGSTSEGSTVGTPDASDATILAAGYRRCLFDGVSRYYVADEHVDALGAGLSYPACTLDDFIDARLYDAERSRAELIADVRRWRSEALTWWPGSGTWAAASELARVNDALTTVTDELVRVRSTLSWRVTTPLRTLRRRGDRA